MFSGRIAVVGAGAVGCYYGGLLVDAGYDVTLIARGKHLSMLQSNGLRIESYKHGQKQLKVNASDEPNGFYDVVIFCVKSQDTVVVCEMMKHHITDSTVLVSFQNGVENIQILGSFFNKKNVLGASLFIGASISAPGVLTHSAHGHMAFGPLVEGDMGVTDKFDNLLSQTQIKYAVEPSIMLPLWKKLLWNIAFNPLSALLESTCGRMVNDAGVVDMMNDLVKEAVDAAALDGIAIPKSYWENVSGMTENLEHYKTSMLQDIEKGKNPEVDGILGPVIRKLQSVGKAAPVSETVYRSLQFKYGSRFLYCPRLAADMAVINGDHILLIERKNHPHGWALPGGFVDYGESVEKAAIRELQEETGIVVDKIELLGIYSDPYRDDRGHTASGVYYTFSNQQAVAADDAKNAVYFPLNALPDKIVFDHKQIIEDLKEVLAQ